jgi:hypothetical protein
LLASGIRYFVSFSLVQAQPEPANGIPHTDVDLAFQLAIFHANGISRQ